MKKLTQISKICDDCDGTGEVSYCCDAPVYDNRCSYCGKFCKIHYCCEGEEVYKVGDEVEIFVCIYTPEHLKDYFYHPKQLGDCKTYQGKILELLDDYHVLVKIRYSRKEPIKLSIDEISVT